MASSGSDRDRQGRFHRSYLLGTLYSKRASSRGPWRHVEESNLTSDFRPVWTEAPQTAAAYGLAKHQASFSERRMLFLRKKIPGT